MVSDDWGWEVPEEENDWYHNANYEWRTKLVKADSLPETELRQETTGFDITGAHGHPLWRAYHGLGAGRCWNFEDHWLGLGTLITWVAWIGRGASDVQCGHSVVDQDRCCQAA